MEALTDALGLVAGLLTTTAFIPQVLKIYNTKSGKDISARMISMFSVGLVLWLIYGFIIRSIPLIAANAFTLVLALAIVVLKIRYSRLHKRDAAVREPDRAAAERACKAETE